MSDGFFFFFFFSLASVAASKIQALPIKLNGIHIVIIDRPHSRIIIFKLPNVEFLSLIVERFSVWQNLLLVQLAMAT